MGSGGSDSLWSSGKRVLAERAPWQFCFAKLRVVALAGIRFAIPGKVPGNAKSQQTEIRSLDAFWVLPREHLRLCLVAQTHQSLLSNVAFQRYLACYDRRQFAKQTAGSSAHGRRHSAVRNANCLSAAEQHDMLGYMVKPHGQLVQVSSTPYNAYTPCLSTS